jgi:MFS family permease
MVNRNVASLALFNLFRGLATGGYMALFAAYMARHGYSMSDIGLVVALSNVVGFITSPAIGYVLEVYSGRLVSTLTGLMLVGSLVLAALSDNILILSASYSLFMLSFYFGQPARMTFLARVTDVRVLGSVVGITSSAFTASRSIGPPLAGFLVVHRGYWEAFILLALTALIGSLLFHIMSDEPRVGSRSASSSYGLLDPYRRLLKPDRSLATLYVFVGFDRAAWMMWFPMLSAFLVKTGYDEAVVGVLIGLSNLLEAALTPIMGRLTDTLGASIVLALSEVSAALAALTLTTINYTGIAGATASMCFIGVSIGSWIPAYNVYIARVYERLGEAYATTNAIRSVAGIPAPYVGGVLQEALALQAPFIVSAFILIYTAFMSLTTLRKTEMARLPDMPVRG